MAFFVHGVLLLWLVIVPWARFTRVPAHLVLGAALVFGLLFLPMVGEGMNPAENGAFAPFSIPGLTLLSLTKYKVLSLSLLLAVLVKGGGWVPGVRLSWMDLPMVLFCLCPLPSVLCAPPPDGSSEWVAGLSQCITTFLLWGLPYFIGKFYFSTLDRQRDLAAVFVLGALLYIPLCLYEIRMSPQLHVKVYGFRQHDFAQAIRFDGFRPMVFMQHGLALSLFLTAATLLAVMLLRGGIARRIPGPPWARSSFLLVSLLLLLAATTILTKSTGALLLGAVGFLVLVSMSLLRTPWLLVGLVLICPLYLTARISGAWTGADLVPLLTKTLGQDRAESFEFRQINEDLLMERAFEAPPFGWAGWGRNYTQDRDGRNLTVPDGLWIIILGERGLPGLISLYLAMLLPVVRFLWTQPAATWSRLGCAASLACAVVVALYMNDNLMNDMHNHVFILMAGALTALVRTRLPVSPLPPSVTDRRVFRWSLLVTRLQRSRMQPPSSPTTDSSEADCLRR